MTAPSSRVASRAQSTIRQQPENTRTRRWRVQDGGRMQFVTSRTKTLLLTLSSCTVLLAPAAQAQAQGQTNKGFVRQLFFQGVVDPQESPALVQEIANESADEIAKLVAAAISTAPVVSSSAGFTYVRDRATGELSLRSQSFGPLFAERALTNGKGVGSFGVSYQHSRTTFDGAFGTADGGDEGL